MPALKTRVDSLREYLSGAGSDGGSQGDPNSSFGNFRSSTEAVSLGIALINPINNLTIDFASGGCAIGNGTLTLVDPTDVTWADAKTGAGVPLNLPNNGSQGIVEAAGNPASYLRLTCNGTMSGGPCTVSLAILVNNQFGFDDVSAAQAAAGEEEYRASMIVNESSGSVTNFKRWIGTLGTQQISDGGGLGASGAGTITTVAGTFNDWPDNGWVNIADSTGTLKEVAYYSSRTSTVLTIPTAGRARLGTTATAGLTNDLINPVPGVAIAADPTGVQNAGSSIQTIANAFTAPSGVSWNLGIRSTSGLSIGTLLTGQIVGIWVWRDIPPGASSNPALVTQFVNSFDAA